MMLRDTIRVLQVELRVRPLLRAVVVAVDWMFVVVTSCHDYGTDAAVHLESDNFATVRRSPMQQAAGCFRCGFIVFLLVDKAAPNRSNLVRQHGSTCCIRSTIFTQSSSPWRSACAASLRRIRHQRPLTWHHSTLSPLNHILSGTSAPPHSLVHLPLRFCCIACVERCAPLRSFVHQQLTLHPVAKSSGGFARHQHHRSSYRWQGQHHPTVGPAVHSTLSLRPWSFADSTSDDEGRPCPSYARKATGSSRAFSTLDLCPPTFSCASWLDAGILTTMGARVQKHSLNFQVRVQNKLSQHLFEPPFYW